MVKLQDDFHFSFGTSIKRSEQPQGDFFARIALQREPCYNSASYTTKKSLDIIQAQSLKICTGSHKSASIHGMQVEMGDPPYEKKTTMSYYLI